MVMVSNPYRFPCLCACVCVWCDSLNCSFVSGTCIPTDKSQRTSGRCRMSTHPSMRGRASGRMKLRAQRLALPMSTFLHERFTSCSSTLHGGSIAKTLTASTCSVEGSLVWTILGSLIDPNHSPSMDVSFKLMVRAWRATERYHQFLFVLFLFGWVVCWCGGVRCAHCRYDF